MTCHIRYSGALLLLIFVKLEFCKYMDVISFNYSNQEFRKLSFDIRRKVFIEEQRVAESEEFDEFEQGCLHYLAFDDGKPVGTSRWRFTADGIKLERFAVDQTKRTKGVGSALMRAMLKDLPHLHSIYLHAQISALNFYKKFGFKIRGEQFTECEIEHFSMHLDDMGESSISLEESINCVKEFHEAFGLRVAHEPLGKVAKKLLKLRFDLMKEENDEYLKAAMDGDLVEIADALGDMLYILNGTILTHGLQAKISPVFEEIQRSNMSKLDKNGKPIYRKDGKVLKSDLYFKPDLAAILKK